MLAGENDKPGVEERYGAAIGSGSVGNDPRTSMSGGDVVAAMGIADRELTQGKTRRRNRETGEVEEDAIKPAPLAVSLERLLIGGDNRAAHEIVRKLAERAWAESHAFEIKIGRADCADMARAVLAWFRHGICRRCGGHGFDLIPGTRTHGGVACMHCKGSGKRALEKEFKAPWRPLVTWLAAEIQREAGRAGPRAMAHLAAKLDL